MKSIHHPALGFSRN